jgi:hypothetical protein
MRNFARVALGATAAIAVTGAAAQAASTAQPTGNAKAIAYAKTEQSAYRRDAGVRYTRRGFAAMRSTIAARSSFHWVFGSGRVPSGWAPATEHIVVALTQGKVSWATDDFTPGGCSASAGCAATPVSILVTRSGAYWRFDSSATQLGCYKKLPGPTSFTVGADWLAVTGTYGPLRRRGSSVLTHASYPWSPAQVAQVTDTVSARSKLLSAERISVSKGASTLPAFTISSTFSHLSTAPTEPALTLCG